MGSLEFQKILAMQYLTILSGCDWRGADYGVMNQCDGDEIPVGACGSGYQGDCRSGATTEVQAQDSLSGA